MLRRSAGIKVWLVSSRHITRAACSTLTAQNRVEKIVQRFTKDQEDTVKSGDYVALKPLHVMTHDNTGAVMPKFNAFFAGGNGRMANPRQPVYTLDHNVQDKSEKNLAKYKSIQEFAKKHGVDFYPAGRGIGHQIMCEEGYAWPNCVVVASDSHSNMYGGLGCLGTPVVRTDAASIWATTTTWWQVPPVAKVHLRGRLRPGVTGKDLIVTLCGHFNQDQVLNHAVEFCGDGVETLSIDERLTIANMTTEWGALAGLFPVDRHTVAWLRKRQERYGEGHPRFTSQQIDALERDPLHADQGASYACEIDVDLATVDAHVSGPNHVKVMSPVRALEKERRKVDKAYIVSCVNSRADDLAAAAEVLRGKKVADHVELYIAAASSEVQADSERRGDWQALVDAGAHVLPPGCGPCIGLGTGLLRDGETGISATNRNFKGRMGSSKAEAFLASPAVVAASAVAGYIASPAERDEHGDVPELVATYTVPHTSSRPVKPVALVPGFPSQVEGQAVFCPVDNMNTDGIYPGKYTYDDDVTPEQQAQVAMENYDPSFGKRVNAGDVLIGGFNFGTGSSREQAATCLKYKGIPLVLAGSFSETYKRNALNNGFLGIEVPGLVHVLRERFAGAADATILTGETVIVDFERSTVSFEGKDYAMGVVGRVAQELVVEGGQEAWVRRRLAP